MQDIILRGRTIVEGRCKAKALVSKMPISFLGGIDPADGKLIEKHQDIRGKCVKDRVLCFPHGRGSTVGSYVLYSLAKRNLAPKAIINQKADPVVVVGAIISDLPMIAGINVNLIRTGDSVEVNATEGWIRVLRKRQH